MRGWRVPIVAAAVAALGVTAPSLKASDDNDRLVVTVSFGAGLNTLASANHHILPPMTRVRVGGVVNFVVAGFHQIFIYNPGTTPEEINAFVAANGITGAVFINDLNNLFYKGINPLRAGAGAGSFPTVNGSVVNGNNNNTPANLADDVPPGDPVRVGFQNRVESVGFTTPGTYLVICNFRPHFQDPNNPMFGYIRVDAAEGPDSSDHKGHKH
jgi:hypothetical protein